MRIPHLLAAAAVVAIVLLAAIATPSAASDVRGDVNCSGQTDSQDALDMLLVLAGDAVAIPEECTAFGLETVDGVGGDVNCDGEYDALDPLTSLKLLGDLPVHPCFVLSSLGFGVVGAEIGPDGGTLSTTGLDGTEFTLDIPAGALLGPEFIKMMPLEEIANLPVPGGLVAAVDLQPSGIEFWNPVILTIEPPTAVAPGDQTPFIISDGEFVLYPLVLESADIQLPLTHFSAAGLAEGPADDLPPLSSAFDVYTAQSAELVNPQRASVLGGGAGDPQFEAELGALMDGYYNAYLAPALELPEASVAGYACRVEITIVRLAWALAAQGQSIGAQQQYPRLQQALQALSPFFAGCRQADFEKCVQSHDLGAIGRIVAYTRVMALLGIPDSPSPLDEMIEKCARFEVTFRAGFCTDQEHDATPTPGPATPDPSATPAPVGDCFAGIDYWFRTRSPQPIFSMSLQPSSGPLVSHPLELYIGRWNPHMGCEGTMTSPGSDFRILGGGVSLNLLRTSGSNIAPPFTLIINPGIPRETLELQCNFGNDTQEGTLWWQRWCSFHKPDMLPHPDPDGVCFLDVEPGGWPFVVTRQGWIGGGDLWVLSLVRTHTQTGVFEIGWETTLISITHRPLP